MSEWKEYKLGDIAEVVSDRVSISKATLDNYISTENMINDFGGVMKAEKLPIATSVNSFNQNDILFSNIRTYFKKVWLSKFNGTVSPDVLVFKARENKCISAHLYYSLCNPDFTEYSVLTSKGAKMPRGDKDALLNFIISLPPLPEQTAIASVLSSLDNKIDLLHRQNATLEKMAETLFRQWFVEEAKEEWEMGKLGDVLHSIESGSRPKGGIDPALNVGIPSIGAESINGIGNYNFSKTKFITMEFFKKMKRGIIEDYDVLIYKDGAYVGRKGMFGKGFPFKECSVNEHVFILRTNEKLNQIFLYFLLQEDELAQLNANSAQPGLNQEAMKSFEIVIPPREKLVDFEKIVKPWVDKIFFNSTQIRTLTALRDTLLPKLMSGEVKVEMN